MAIRGRPVDDCRSLKSVIHDGWELPKQMIAGEKSKGDKNWQKRGRFFKLRHHFLEYITASKD